MQVLPNPMEATLAPRRPAIGPTHNKWSLTYLGVMVPIWVPLSKRATQLSLSILTLAMFLTPYHRWKESGFKKGFCRVGFYTPGASIWVSLWHWLLPEGSGLHLSMLSPPCHLTVSFLWKSLQVGNCRWNVLDCYSGSSVSHLLGCLL